MKNKIMRFVKELEERYSQANFNKKYNELTQEEKKYIAKEIFKDGV